MEELDIKLEFVECVVDIIKKEKIAKLQALEKCRLENKDSVHHSEWVRLGIEEFANSLIESFENVLEDNE